MDAPIRLRYEGNGDFRVLSNYWAMRADRDFVVGEVYPMVQHQERSQSSHNHYFATLANGWANLPDDKLEEYPTAEHLRKKLLVRCGYSDERSIVCSSKAEAQRVAAFIKPSDPYAVVMKEREAHIVNSGGDTFPGDVQSNPLVQNYSAM